jgi:hypothetical protein
MIPTEEIVKEIKGVDSIVEGVPTSDEIREHADVSYYTIHQRFGGVVEARKAAGVNGGDGTLCENHPNLEREDILSEVRRVYDEVERPPSIGDLEEHSNYEVGTMLYRFGGVGDLREEAGLMRDYNHHGDTEQSKVIVKCENCGCEESVYPARAEDYTYCSRDCMGDSQSKYSTGEIRSALKSLAEELGKAPSTREFDENTQYMHGQFEMREDLESFSTELRKMGYEPRCPKDLSEEELLQDLIEINEKRDEPPKQRHLSELGRVNTAEPYLKIWGSWLNALSHAGIEPDNGQRVKIEREELVKDFKSVAEAVGHPPSYNEIDEHSQFSPATYEREFGSFLDAKAACGFEPVATDNLPRGEDHYAWKGGTKPHYGKSWRKQREKAIKRDGHTCQSCGMTSEQHLNQSGTELHVHHITPWDEFDNHKERNKLPNLITLCAKCHRKWESIPVKPQVSGDSA